MKEEYKTIIEKHFGTKFVLGAAFIYMLLGVLLLFVPHLMIVHICYAIATLFVIYGIYQIVLYFVNESYKNLNRYGFSTGVFLVIIGICIFVQVLQVEKFFTTFLGMCILLTATVKIQHAMDLKTIKDTYWMVSFIAGCAMSIFAMVILINPMNTQKQAMKFTYIVLIIDGLLTIISTFYLRSRLNKYQSNYDKEDKSVTIIEEYENEE